MISVIIPAFNVERYLRQCIDSLASELRQDAEIIIVDDGSTDSTPFICDELAARYSPVVTVLHKANGGVQTARNLGYSKARGEWIWFVDSDDVAAPGALRKLALKTDATSADAIYMGLTVFEEDGSPDWAAQGSNAAEIVGATDFLSGTYSQRYAHYLWEYVFRKDVLAKMADLRPSGVVGPCREEFSFLDDLVFTEEFLRLAKTVEIIPEVLYGYRQVGTSITHRCSPKAARSALLAIRSIDTYQVEQKDRIPRELMQIGLLFNAYRAAGIESGASELRSEIANEISVRVHAVGITRLSPGLLVRYFALRTGLGDLVLRRRGKRK